MAHEYEGQAVDIVLHSGVVTGTLESYRGQLRVHTDTGTLVVDLADVDGVYPLYAPEPELPL